MNLIEVKNLTLTYDSRTIAAENLNFQVEEGDYLCIVGQNGAGKSSLIKGLLQLIRPAGGEIILNPSLDPRDIGYLPQQTTVQRLPCIGPGSGAVRLPEPDGAPSVFRKP